MLTIIVPILKSKNGDITIVKQMPDYLWTTDNQFAYKKGHSTEMCIFLLEECVRYHWNHKTPLYVCSLDASKAFDCMNHWKLFQLLIERKCPANILKALVYWYQE